METLRAWAGVVKEEEEGEGDWRAGVGWEEKKQEKEEEISEAGSREARHSAEMEEVVEEGGVDP